MKLYTSGAVLIVSLIVTLVVEGNMTSSSQMKIDKSSFRDKHHRLITFNTDEDSHVGVELSFSVPFLTIPVKKTLDTAKGAVANINVAAIVLSGMMVLGSSLAIPLISYLYSKKSASGKYRNDDTADWTEFWKPIDKIFTTNNLNSSVCLQRMVCWAVKNASVKVSKGSASSGYKIVDGIATNEWFSNVVEGTILESAIRNGLSKANCSKLYGSQCKISQRNLEKSVKDVIKNFS